MHIFSSVRFSHAFGEMVTVSFAHFNFILGVKTRIMSINMEVTTKEGLFMPKALLIVDYTNDFVAENGNLTAGAPAQAIEQRVCALADQFRAADDFVYLPTDLHTENDPYHPETKLFPPHNRLNTWGREYYGALQDWYLQHQDDPNVTAFPKRRYSSFAGTPLDEWLRERQVRDVTIIGVCTDICVLHTAIDAYNLGYNITVCKDAVATFNPAGQDFALAHFKNTLGARVI